MPMPKGTKPRARHFQEVHNFELRAALTAYTAVTKDVLRKWENGNRTWWSDSRGDVVAKHHTYRKSEQCLVAVHLREYIPDNANNNKEAAA